jgi:hypothetical protein
MTTKIPRKTIPELQRERATNVKILNDILQKENTILENSLKKMNVANKRYDTLKKEYEEMKERNKDVNILLPKLIKELQRSHKGPMGSGAGFGNKIGYVMNEFKRGKLKMRNGKKVTDPRQAIAIALSENRRWQPQRKYIK